MNWKEFFMPTIWKVIITIFLSVLFTPFVHFDSGIVCITSPCGGEASGTLAAYLFSKRSGYPNSSIVYFSYGKLFFGLIISYLISCVPVYVYQRKESKAQP